MTITKVVIGYDPSDRAMRAFRDGVELASALGAQIHLVTAFADRHDGGVTITPERRRAEELLEKAARSVAPPLEVHQHAIPSRPAEAIVRVAAETGADMIVIGNRGATGPARVLGSVASAIVGHAPCSVFIVRTA